MDMEEYLQILLEQIRCRKVRPVIEEEMRGHILEQAQANRQKGMDEEEAEQHRWERGAPGSGQGYGRSSGNRSIPGSDSPSADGMGRNVPDGNHQYFQHHTSMDDIRMDGCCAGAEVYAASWGRGGSRLCRDARSVSV